MKKSLVMFLCLAFVVSLLGCAPSVKKAAKKVMESKKTIVKKGVEDKKIIDKPGLPQVLKKAKEKGEKK